MKFARFCLADKIAYGVVEDDQIREITGTPLSDYRDAGVSHHMESVQLLAPIPRPGKILAMALNYRSHVGSAKEPKRPEPFYKTASSVIGPGDAIVIPEGATRVDAEGELVAVIGKLARNVKEDEALDYVLGFTCGNDVSARDWQREDVQWWRAKSSDTFAPIGPVIATDLEPDALEIVVRLNGDKVQRCDSSEMIFNVSHTIADVSKYVTLEPGDLLFTGTSGTTAQINPGDTVEVEISNIGALRNAVQ